MTYGDVLNFSEIIQKHEFTEFTEASSVNNAGISKHRLSPYTAYYLK